MVFERGFRFIPLVALLALLGVLESVSSCLPCEQRPVFEERPRAASDALTDSWQIQVIEIADDRHTVAITPKAQTQNLSVQEFLVGEPHVVPK
jgi:hypothetical protein